MRKKGLLRKEKIIIIDPTAGQYRNDISKLDLFYLILQKNNLFYLI